MHEHHWVRCAIELGGFSSERTFEIDLGDGEKLVGTALLEYLRDENFEKLDDDDPHGERIEGFVACRVLRRTETDIWVEVPSADVIRVPVEAVQEMSA